MGDDIAARDRYSSLYRHLLSVRLEPEWLTTFGESEAIPGVTACPICHDRAGPRGPARRCIARSRYVVLRFVFSAFNPKLPALEERFEEYGTRQ